MAPSRLLRSLLFLALPLLLLPCFISTPTTATHLATRDFVTLEAQPSASLVQVATSYKSTRMFLSEVYEAKTPFQLIGLDWQQALPTGTAAALGAAGRRFAEKCTVENTAHVKGRRHEQQPDEQVLNFDGRNGQQEHTAITAEGNE